MKNVNELRIGNYVKAEEMNLFRVDEIFLSEHQGYVLRMYIQTDPERSHIDLPIDMAECVPLSIELMDKIGVSIQITDLLNRRWIIGGAFYVDLVVPDLPVDELLQPVHFVVTFTGGFMRIAGALHYLQNICYLLTGRELQINL